MGCQQSSPQDITISKKRKIHPINSQNQQKSGPQSLFKTTKTQPMEPLTDRPCLKEIILSAKNIEGHAQGVEKDIHKDEQSSVSSTNSGVLDYSVDYSVDHYKKREEEIRLMKQLMKKTESKSRLVGKDKLVVMSSSYKKVSISGLMNGKTTVEMSQELKVADHEVSFDEALSSDNEFSRSLDSFFQSESSISIYKIEGEDGDASFDGSAGDMREDGFELETHQLERRNSGFEASELSCHSLRSLRSLNDLIC